MAYVAGLPIPNSSSFFTKEASVYLEGGLEKDSLEEIDNKLRFSSIVSTGKTPFSSSISSSVPSLYTLRKPSNFITSPFATKN